MQIPRQAGKSDASRILQGMDFGKLEQTALQLLSSGRIVSSDTVNKQSYLDQLDLYQAITNSLFGTTGKPIMMDDPYTSPKPHCMSQVHDIIDSFWSAPALGLYGQYIDQLDKKPKTKDVFKGKSTTHHYPWYRRGTKY